MKWTPTPEQLRNPLDSHEIYIRIEDAYDCYGEPCNSCVTGLDGELEPLAPHSHIVVVGKNPETTERRSSVGVFGSVGGMERRQRVEPFESPDRRHKEREGDE